MSVAWLQLVAATASAIAAISSAVTVAIALRAQRRHNSADAYLRVSSQFETDRFREYRSTIYALDRGGFEGWTKEEMVAVDTMCAHLDLLAVLIRARQLDKTSIFEMYGDVVMRIIYQVAPYCNHQIAVRGKQFMLPLRLLTTDLVKFWRK